MKDELYGNKVAAAVLIIMLMFFGLPILVNTFYGGVGHHGGAHADEENPDNPLGLAYPIEFTLEGGSAEAAPEPDLGTLMADASAAAGERAVAICLACHTFEEGGANGTGPNLWGVIGRDIASVDGFSYTGALQALEGDWSYEKMDEYLANSQAYVPGTQMAQRIGKDDKRADILAYLSTLTSGEPLPFPEPAPEPAEDMAAADGAEGEMDAPATPEDAADASGEVADMADNPAGPGAVAETESDGDTAQGEIEE